MLVDTAVTTLKQKPACSHDPAVTKFEISNLKSEI
jgi:hypothetical protein